MRDIHTRINRFLAILLLLIGLYLLVTPLIPSISYQVKATPQPSKDTQPINENRLIIPQPKINTKIVEGSNISVIDNGNVWHRPLSSNDPGRGNFVIVGHNFTYKDPFPPFYSLNKTNLGDEIQLDWQGARYNYKVTNKKIVSPFEVSVEDPTKVPTITLYTCYPMFTANQRIVIQGELAR